MRRNRWEFKPPCMEILSVPSKWLQQLRGSYDCVDGAISLTPGRISRCETRTRFIEVGRYAEFVAKRRRLHRGVVRIVDLIDWARNVLGRERAIGAMKVVI